METSSPTLEPQLAVLADGVPTKPRISIVVAIGDGPSHNRVIGDDNKLIWHIPDDLKRFKNLTLGHPIIMGRKTFESIVTSLGKALPGRTNIVVTRDWSWTYPDILIAHSLEEAIVKASDLDHEEIFIGGGGQLYTEALPFVDRLYLTLIHDEKQGDSFFPPYEALFTKKISEEAGNHNGLAYTWIDLDRA